MRPLLPEGRQLLLGGDYNCVAGPEDVLGPYTGSARFEGHTGGLAVVEGDRDLVDAWRFLHPRGVGFTHTGTTGLSSARLDRWLVSRDLLHGLLSSDEIVGLPGDHLGISITVRLQQGVLKGRGAWALPVALLDDEAFVTRLS